MPRKPKPGRPRENRTPRGIASRLRKAREQLGLSAEEAAAKIGVGRSTWYDWEAGSVPPLTAGCLAADLVGLSPHQLAFGAALIKLPDDTELPPEA